MATRNQPAAPPMAARHPATVAIRAQRDDADTVVTPARHDVIGHASRGPGFPPGTSIHQYELIRRLGSGGMGDVYLASDIKLARRMAIKFLHHPDRSLSERFTLKAQATARCSHENIATIYDVEELRGVPFMVLEYLKGETLGDIVGDGKLPPSRVVQFMVPVVRALVCAHQHKIVHRDVKPANIGMTDAGTIKVLDFGVAKVVQGMYPSTEVMANTAVAIATGMHRLLDITHGALVGTLPYMSPEQWRSDTVDPRSDLWAVGILLYRMVVGRHPLAPLGGKAAHGHGRARSAHAQRAQRRRRHAPEAGRHHRCLFQEAQGRAHVERTGRRSWWAATAVHHVPLRCGSSAESAPNTTAASAARLGDIELRVDRYPARCELLMPPSRWRRMSPSRRTPGHLPRIRVWPELLAPWAHDTPYEWDARLRARKLCARNAALFMRPSSSAAPSLASPSRRCLSPLWSSLPRRCHRQPDNTA
jgi:serine/threonine protein kinase